MISGIDPFDNDVIRGEALWQQSLFMTYRRYTSFPSCSPLLICSQFLYLPILDHLFRTKLTDFSAIPRITSLIKASIII